MLMQKISICVMGASIGWLSGLSVSPVIATVLSSLVGIGAGIITGLRLISREGQSVWEVGKNIDARPAALFMLAIALAAPLGIMARTHEVFGHQAQQTIDSNDHSEQESKEPRKRQTTAALFWNESELCTELLTTKRDDVFRNNVQYLGDEGAALVEAIPDIETLRRVVEALCFSE